MKRQFIVDFFHWTTQRLKQVASIDKARPQLVQKYPLKVLKSKAAKKVPYCLVSI